MRTRIRPSRESSVLGIVVGIIMLVVGIAFVGPMTSAAGSVAGPGAGMFAVFGVAWLLIVGATIAYSAYNLFSDRGVSLYDIETEGSPPGSMTAQGRTADFDTRLRKLQQLRDDGLLTPEEFERKRGEILSERW